MASPTYKVSATDAAAMAQQWYAMVPSVAGEVTPAQMAQGVQWWTKQIQQDGSNTAFKNFQSGIAKDHGPAAAQELASNTAAYTQKTGLNPWTPASGAVNGQLPGTNTKAGGANGFSSLGDALNPFAQIKAAAQGNWSEALMPDPINQYTGGNVKVAGPVLDTVASIYGGPAGGAAAGALNSALQKGSTPGSDLGGAATGLAVGGLGKAAVGGVEGLLGSGASAAGSAAGSAGSAAAGGVPDASTMSPGALADAANAGVPNAGTMDPGALASAANAGGSGASAPASSSWLSSLLGGGGSSTGGLNLSSLLSGAAGAANAYTNYENEQQQNAIKEAQAQQQEAEFNRTTADTEGMDAASLQKSLNNAPLRDKAQALMLARLGAPATPFQPRDLTHGNTAVMNGAASGGIAPTMNAVSQAAQAYTPGSGGVNTSTDQTLVNRFLNPQQTTSSIPGGYTLPGGPQYPASTTPVSTAPKSSDATTNSSIANAPTISQSVTPSTQTTPLTPLTSTAAATLPAPGMNAEEDDPNALLQSRLLGGAPSYART